MCVEWEGDLRERVSASDQETRDRAERGSVVRGSARASVLAPAGPPPTPQGVDAKKSEELSPDSKLDIGPSYYLPPFPTLRSGSSICPPSVTDSLESPKIGSLDSSTM